MKVPLVEITESLGMQNSGKAINDVQHILWALHPKGYPQIILLLQTQVLSFSNTLAACFGCNVSVFHANSRRMEQDRGPSILSRLSAIHLTAGIHKITAIAWLVNLVPQLQNKNRVELDAFTAHVMVGNEKGEFMVYDLTGELIVHQKLHSSAVLHIRCRPCAMGLEENSMEEISVIFSDALCCVPLPELHAFIRLHEAGSGQIQDPTLKLAHGKFGFGKGTGYRTDGLHLGSFPPSLMEELKSGNQSEELNKIGILTVGKSPSVGLYEASIKDPHGGALAFIGKMASAVTLGIPTMAWNRGQKAWKKGVSGWWNGAKEEEATPIEQTQLQSSLRDSKRQVLSLIPAPMDTVAVCTDALGRILLMDTRNAIILRIWKGYREAECAWLTRKKEKLNDRKLYLVIFGKKRETIEVWSMRYGPRIWSLFVGSNNRLLSTVPPMTLGEAKWSVNCYVLDCENEEIWNVEDKAFTEESNSHVEAVWDTMMTQT